MSELFEAYSLSASQEKKEEPYQPTYIEPIENHPIEPVENMEPMENKRPSQSSTPLPFLFGPLPPSYCYLFYVFSLLGFVLCIVAILGFIVMLVKPPKTLNWALILTVLFQILLYFVMYIQNRLFFNMCSK
jgi:hypothetical protein